MGDNILSRRKFSQQEKMFSIGENSLIERKFPQQEKISRQENIKVSQ